MTLAEIQEQIMFQSNNDVDDLEDFLPHVNDYINDGYDKLVMVWTKSHHIPADEYPRLEEADDVPNLPEWIHRYICDWATWLVYRNGNPQKQQRGRAYYESFMGILSQISGEGGADGLNADGSVNRYRNFRNIPT